MTAALAGVHSAHQARFGELAGTRVPLGYGDFAAEVQTLRDGVGVLDLEPCGVIVVRGPEAAPFLAGLTTNDVQRLAVGGAMPDLLCANKGKILHPIDVLRVTPDQYLLVTLPGDLERAAGHLDAYHIREDVEIGTVPLVRIDLIGPHAEAALHAVGAASATSVGTYREAPLLTPAYPLGPLPRVMVLLPAPHAQPWVEALLAAVPQARMVGHEAAEELRIQAGVPRFGVDYGREHLPAEAALYDRLSFNKGCYVGQEVHARLHHRGHVNRKLAAVALPEAAAPDVTVGAPLHAGDKVVGELTSFARLPLDDERRGIAMLRYDHVQTGAPVALAPGGPTQVRIAALATDLGAQRA